MYDYKCVWLLLGVPVSPEVEHGPVLLQEGHLSKSGVTIVQH
jgi:hypothetical protein